MGSRGRFTGSEMLCTANNVQMYQMLPSCVGDVCLFLSFLLARLSRFRSFRVLDFDKDLDLSLIHI